MKRRTWLAFLAVVLTVFTAIGLAWIVVVREKTPPVSLLPKPSDEAKRDEELVTVLVARAHMPSGVQLTEHQDWFETKAIPRGQVPEHAVTKFDQLHGRFLDKDLAKGEAVDAAHLLVERVGLRQDKGRRAIAISVIYPADEFDWFQSGSIVCVEQILKNDSAGAAYKQDILDNVLLIAIDGLNLGQFEELKAGTLSAPVVLYLTPEETQVLFRAEKAGGTLRLRQATSKGDLGPAHPQAGGHR